MTEIEFHFNVPDKLLYSCRLLRKVVRTGARAVVTAESSLLVELDQLLWSFSPTEFIPHCMVMSEEQSFVQPPVLLSVRPGTCPTESVLINLGENIPDEFERFERFIEIVANQEDDRLSGRSRWMHYKKRGYALKRHDLSASRESV